MSETHTPGPWELGSWGDNVFSVQGDKWVVEAERDELRETMAESCCSKLEANQRIANAQAEAASVFVPELRELQAELDARGQILDNIQTATGSTWWNGAIDWADRIFAAIQKADSIPGYQSKVTRELVPAYIGQLAKDRDHADRMYQAAADIATNHEKTISTLTADLAAKDAEIARLVRDLEREERDHENTIDHRDKHEERINAIVRECGLGEYESSWTSHNDPSHRAIEYIASVEAQLTTLRTACESYLSTMQEEARMRQDYPAGTCNAEDAWRDYDRRKSEALHQLTAALAKGTGE